MYTVRIILIRDGNVYPSVYVSFQSIFENEEVEKIILKIDYDGIQTHIHVRFKAFKFPENMILNVKANFDQ